MLPDGTPMSINCEVTNFGTSLAIYKKPNDDMKFEMLARLTGEGVISALLPADRTTELLATLAAL